MFFAVCLLIFFFFKQKTAYEMRISDWSSDVCSSDLCWTVPHAAPPPWLIRLKKRRSPSPSSRPRAISEEVSMVNVTMPSTSEGARPASASAALIASAESWSSERPDSLANSVAPMRSEEHTSELQSLMHHSYAVLCLKKNIKNA